MSHSAFTASERRGMLIIAIISLLLVGAGMVFSFCNRSVEEGSMPAEVETYPEMVDSLALQKMESEKTQKNRKKKSSEREKTKTKKTYRKRSPLDEPV